MQALTKLLLDKDLANRTLSEARLAELISGTPQRRYNLVNRAMKAGELIRVRRGCYVLGDRYRDHAVHPFALAQAFVPGSYISFETALAHHGWIPEFVRVTASVTPGRKSVKYDHPEFGSFSFHPLATRPGYFLELIERRQITVQTMLVAKPIRALMDLVCLRKVEWQGLEWLMEGLRIDYEYLCRITSSEFKILGSVYSQKRVKSFLHSLAKELGND